MLNCLTNMRLSVEFRQMCKMFLFTFIILGAINLSLTEYTDSSNANDGYGYGFSSSFSGGANNAVPPGFPGGNFENFFNQYFDSLRKYNEQFLRTLQDQFQQIQKQAASVPAGAANGGFGDSAVASAMVGPQGTYQTAAVYPENPNSPNIVSRFGEPNRGNGNYGVFTSSVSSSSNLDGKTHNFRQATTTINDNGKISTYTVKSP